MSKKNIIFICAAVAVIIAIALIVYFVLTSNNSANNTDKIVITKYNDNFEVEQTIEITNKKEMKEFKNIYENVSLEQDDTTPYLAIRNDAKVDLGNGKFFMLQLDLNKYCYYENPETNTKLVIKMPAGLLEKVNEIFQ